jgi:hypothetical protein
LGSGLPAHLKFAPDRRQIILIIDQTQANKAQQAIVDAARVGGRSLPIAW